MGRYLCLTLYFANDINYKAFFVIDTAEFEAGGGPSLTILVSSIMCSTDELGFMLYDVP